MATVTGFTAERMLVIENSTVVDGDIVGDNLILKTRDGTPIDAGNVRGPQGVVGPAGPSLPPGSMTMFAGATAPAGYLLCDGASISRTTYASLFAAIGTAYGSVDANTFSLPDMRNRFAVGPGPAAWSDVLNKRGGNKDDVVISHTHSGGSHSHSVNIASDDQNANHSHGININTSDGNADHTHSSGGYYMGRNFINAGLGGGGFWLTLDPSQNLPTTGMSSNHAHNVSGGTSGVSNGHAHGVNGNTGANGISTSATGVSGTDANLPPYITVNYIIKT